MMIILLAEINIVWLVKKRSFGGILFVGIGCDTFYIHLKIIIMMRRRNEGQRGFAAMDPERRRQVASRVRAARSENDRFEDDYEDSYYDDDYDDYQRTSGRYQDEDDDYDEGYREVGDDYDDEEDYDRREHDYDQGPRWEHRSSPEHSGRRGFAAMDRDEVRRYGRMGGHASGSSDFNRNVRRHEDDYDDYRRGSREGERNYSSGRGFAAMDPERLRRIARKGGRASHQGRQQTSNSGRSGRNSSSRRSYSRYR